MMDTQIHLNWFTIYQSRNLFLPINITDHSFMNHYPTGAEALLIALQTPAPKGHRGIPVLLWGKPGVGKSSFLDSLAKADFPVLTLIASIHDPTDFSGLPVHHEGKVRYAVPEWLSEFGEDGQGILFLDELTTAPPAVQSALLRVVLERKVGFHPLPNGVRIAAAANPPDLMIGGWELSPPLRNRFVHLEWDLPTEVYLEGLLEGFPAGHLPEIDEHEHANVLPKWKAQIAGFLKRAPDLLHTSPDQEPFAFASPRTWDFAAALLASCDLLGKAPSTPSSDSNVSLALLSGALGEGVAIPFLEFLYNLKLPDPDEVLDGQLNLNTKDFNDNEVFVLFTSLNRALQQRFEKPQLVEATYIYFALTESIFTEGRRDLIYVPLKRIARAGLLTKAMAAAQKQSSTQAQEMMGAISSLFADSGLKEFIHIFEG